MRFHISALLFEPIRHRQIARIDARRVPDAAFRQRVDARLQRPLDAAVARHAQHFDLRFATGGATIGGMLPSSTISTRTGARSQNDASVRSRSCWRVERRDQHGDVVERRRRRVGASWAQPEADVIEIDRRRREIAGRQPDQRAVAAHARNRDQVDDESHRQRQQPLRKQHEFRLVFKHDEIADRFDAGRHREPHGPAENADGASV